MLASPGPPVHPLGGQRVGADRRGDLVSQEDECEVVDQEERRPNVAVLARPSDAHVDHHVEEAPGRGVPPSEQRGSRGVVRQEQPAQVGRQGRAGRETPGERLGERAPRFATDEQLDELVGRHGLEDRVKRPRRELVDLGAQAVLAPEVVEDERRRDASLGGDLADRHGVRTTFGEEPQRGIPDGCASGQVGVVGGLNPCSVD